MNTPIKTIASLALALPTLAACLGDKTSTLCRPADIPAAQLTIGTQDYSSDVAALSIEPLPETGAPSIYITFNAPGAARFEALTTQSVGEVIPIAVDGEVVLSPRVAEPIRGGTVVMSQSYIDVDLSDLALSIAPPCAPE